MTEFTIYSIGDSAFLTEILNAVAMITKTDDFKDMVGIGVIIGIIVVAVQSILQGAIQINGQQVIVGVLLYSLFFVPKSTVKIEDAYTGDVYTVSHVPIGIGFAGGIISNIGYKATRLFEDGYRTIDKNITKTDYSESLKLLNNVRRGVYDSAIFTALNQAKGGNGVDIRRSIDNYIRECTLTKIDLNKASLDDIMTLPIDQALQFDSSLYGTKLYLNLGSDHYRENYSCSEAWGHITRAFNGLKDHRVKAALDNLMGGKAFNRIENSLQAIGASSDSAFDYIKVSLLEPLYYEAAAGRYQDLQDYSSALMVSQAIQQRNTQSAAEQSMFMSIIKPVMTFFEGFVYAITPIMAFIIVMGATGLSLAGKYFQTILWIQLWMPVMSITNLFIHMAAKNQMKHLVNDGLDSIYALSSTGDILQNWVATGGMLSAVTPVISLFIVTGSTYAFTSLANRFNSAEHVNEKIQSPDALGQGAVMSNQPAFTHSPFGGSIATGAESMIGTMSLGSSLGSGVSSARTFQNQKSEAFTNRLGHEVTNSVSQEQAYLRLESIGKTTGSMNTRQSQMIDNRTT